MPLQSSHNLYPGVNAHAHSWMQSEGGGWESFHVEHIVQISHALNRQIRPKYFAAAERSLQISQTSFAEEVRRRVQPDVTIFQKPLQPTPSSSALVAASPFAVLSLDESMPDPDDFLASVIIYEVQPGRLPGKPVTRIELLSPANKPGHSYYRQYMAKRVDTLKAGMSLVEIDYLHETQPILAKLPSYADHERHAYPYLILVSDPKPEQDNLKAYGFGVDEIIPVIEIPLSDQDYTLLDFGAVYQTTFDVTATLQESIDYELEPERMDTYTPADQERIRQRMKTIAANQA